MDDKQKQTRKNSARKTFNHFEKNFMNLLKNWEKKLPGILTDVNEKT
jgi:hypothetical protein